jgi:ABC-type nitrate/sulfonate/bicarbonate transport system permease component
MLANEETTATQARPRLGIPLRERRIALAVLGLLLALCVWELVVRAGIVSSQDVPPASEVVRELAQLAGAGAFWGSVGSTTLGAAIGLVIGAVIGIPIGMLMASARPVGLALHPTVEFLRPVPGIALVPLAVLIWGNSLQAVSALVAFACVWPFLIQGGHGVRSLNEVARDTARSLRLTRGQRVLWVALPSSLPSIATGFRICSGLAIMVAVSAELLSGAPGLGSGILLAQQGAQVTTMYALIVASGLLGIVVNVAVTQAERRALRWHESQRQATIEEGTAQ